MKVPVLATSLGLLALVWSNEVHANGFFPSNPHYPVGGVQSGEYGTGGDEKRTTDTPISPGEIPAFFGVRLASRNPANQHLVFEIALPRRALLTAETFDVAGRVASPGIRNREFASGTHVLTMSLPRRPGEYFVRVTMTHPVSGAVAYQSVRKIVGLR